MIKRTAKREIMDLLDEFPAVGILGPRQIGKTTIADEIAASKKRDVIYLDLENQADRNKVKEPEAYFDLHKGKLIILDEIQRLPEIFSVLRGVIDKRRREGFRTGQFLILGSASLELLKQSSESLAGRIAYKELFGLTVVETGLDKKESGTDALWLRGGFPDSYLSKTNESSLRWRQNFITTYLERDVPQLGPRIPAVTLRRLWTMLAHNEGGLLNISKLAPGLDATVPTVKRYIELLEDLLLIRSLRPWSGNIAKRLIKSPKVYIRDSGITHALLNIATMDELLSHPVAGASWESFVIENLLSSLPAGASSWFYRTAAGAEIDLVIEQGRTKYAIEIKRSFSPVISKGFYLGCEDIGATKRFVVYSGEETYPISKGVSAISIAGMMKELRK